MRIPPVPHSWELGPSEAIALQRQLAERVEREDRLGPVRFVAGVDMSANDRTGLARAAVVILSYPELREVEVVREEQSLRMPYIPGLLSFREAPVILSAFERVRQAPDLLFVDGQGIAHPRRLGIASHLGVLLDLPAIGCAKSLFVGQHEPVADAVGAQEPLIHRGEVIGMVLRTRAHVKPMIISTGHRVSLATAVRYVLACGRGYRLPEPTRLADKRAGEREAPAATPE
jgi:deoxyribonuclease V